jgi:hypothetical protein
MYNREMNNGGHFSTWQKIEKKKELPTNIRR